MPKTLPHPPLETIGLSTILSALADPVRRHLIRAVYRNKGSLECGMLTQNVDLTVATLSHHWRVLREAGLTKTTVRGRSRLIELRYSELEARYPGLIRVILSADEPSDQVALKGDE
jgi:DNA-binding transcriptional ArsR family regulator